ncbi:hypothetical protein BRUCa_0432 [Brucella melitensis]|nr:hypothetical protein BM28_A0435 [Brucella melitensis M28]AIB24744.1 Hypothetical protein BSPT2_I1287 [Brucella suis bv. 2]
MLGHARAASAENGVQLAGQIQELSAYYVNVNILQKLHGLLLQ